MENSNFKYDIALSFAGEDRFLVDKIANILKSIGIVPFYDNFFIGELFGSDLFNKLRSIYKDSSRFVVIFISKHYKTKLWTMHEWNSIKEAILERKYSEYILPIYLDDTVLDDLPKNVGHIRSTDVNTIVGSLIEKINPRIKVSIMIEELKDGLKDYDVWIDEDRIYFKCEIENYQANFPLKLLLDMYEEDLLYEMFILPAIVPN